MLGHSREAIFYLPSLPRTSGSLGSKSGGDNAGKIPNLSRPSLVTQTNFMRCDADKRILNTMLSLC